jgi:hypothetical protein
MQLLWRRFVVLLVAFAFIAGGVIGAAAPSAVAAEPCTQGHGHADHQAGHHQHGKKPDHDKSSRQGACIQCCCVGICAAIPDVTGALANEPIVMTRVVYRDTARFAVGRSIKPEHGPPRLLA